MFACLRYLLHWLSTPPKVPVTHPSTQLSHSHRGNTDNTQAHTYWKNTLHIYFEIYLEMCFDYIKGFGQKCEHLYDIHSNYYIFERLKIFGVNRTTTWREKKCFKCFKCMLSLYVYTFIYPFSTACLGTGHGGHRVSQEALPRHSL